jgi:hypothetical protein
MGASKELLKGLLDNPNFKKWFGESAVRDAEGLPLEVYHGTGRPGFTDFDPALAGKNEKADFGKGAGYFTDDSALASGYAMKRGDGGGVVPGYASISNPYVIYQDKVSRGWEPPASFVDDLKAKGHDGIAVKLRDMDESTGEVFDEFFEEVIPFSPTQFKSRFNQGTFDPTDPNFLKSAGLMTAGAGAAYGLAPDEAEAAKLPWQADAKAQLLSQFFEGLRAGKVQPQVFEDLAGLNGGFKLPEYLLTEADIQHLFEQRMLGNNWDADRVVAALEKLTGSPTARGIQNFQGRGAKEAVWHEQKPRGIFAPVVPGEDGEVRIYSLMDPSPNRVNSYLNKLGDSSGGRMSPPSTYAGRERTPSDSVTQLHRAKLSAVDEPNTDKDQIMPDANTVKKILSLGFLGGAGLGAYEAADPDKVEAAKLQKLLDFGDVKLPIDSKRRATPPDLRDNAIVRFDQSGPNEASGLMGYNAPPRFSVDPRRVAKEAIQESYSPADMVVAALTGGGGVAARAAQGALDPVVSAGMEYLPGLMRDINPVNWMTGVSRY